MATTLPELRQFLHWQRAGAVLLSTSGMRYAPEMRADFSALGELRWITSFTCKSWERYGIHALEAVAPLMGPGFRSVRAQSNERGDVMQITHASGLHLSLGALHDAYGSFGAVHLHGTQGDLALKLRDTYHAFRGQLLAFIELLRSGQPPLSFEQTVELMAVLIAGIRSRQQQGREVAVAEILSEL
jgi:hypothetical protein